MEWLQRPQAVSLVLSLFGICFLVVCLLLISLNRVPSLKSSEKIKAFGVDVNVSAITILVFVGLSMSLTSTYMQVQNYEGQLAETRRQVEESNGRSRALEMALARAGKTNISARIKLEGVANPKQLPQLSDAYCRYFDADKGAWVNEVKVTPGVALDYVVTLENITSATRIERIEFVDRKTNRTWYVESVAPLAPTLTLRSGDLEPK